MIISVCISYFVYDLFILCNGPGNRVHLSFRRMDIEATDFCNTDFVEVHEEGPSGPLLGHFCGNEIPGNLTAAQKLWVLFRSDENGQAPGFMADYSLSKHNYSIIFAKISNDN